MSRVEQAVGLFNQGFACSQAILAAYGEEFGLDRDLALKLGDGFAGGIAGTGEICGAATGAIMVIGLRHGRTRASHRAAKAKTRDVVREFLSRFESRCHSTLCRGILGVDIDTPDGSAAARAQGLFKAICPEAVRAAAEILEEL